MFSTLLVVLVAITFTTGAPHLKDDGETLINNAKLQKLGLLGADENVTDSPKVFTSRIATFPIYAAAARILENQYKLFQNAPKFIKTISENTPERFHVAHNSIPENTRDAIEKRKPNTNRLVEEDEIENVVAGLNLWNIGRKQYNKISTKIRQPIQLALMNGFVQDNSDVARATIQNAAAYDKHGAIHSGSVAQVVMNPEYTADVARARKEHLSAYAEQVAIHKELQNIARKNENLAAGEHAIDFKVNPEYTLDVARARDEHLAAYEEQVAIHKDLQSIAKNNANTAVNEYAFDFKVHPEYTLEVAKARNDHLAAHAEQVAILGALQNVAKHKVERVNNEPIVNFNVNPEYTKEVTNARNDHLAAYAEQVAIHKALHEAADHVSEKVSTKSLVKETLNPEYTSTIVNANDQHLKTDKIKQATFYNVLHEVTERNEEDVNAEQEYQIKSRFDDTDLINTKNDRVDTVNKLHLALIGIAGTKAGAYEEKTNAQQVLLPSELNKNINNVNTNLKESVLKIKIHNLAQNTDRCTNLGIFNNLALKSGQPVKSKRFTTKRRNSVNPKGREKTVELIIPKNLDTENVHLQQIQPAKIVEESGEYDHILGETNADSSKNLPKALSLLDERGNIEVNIVLADSSC